jgi:two-component system, LytTR family, sensor kinase
MNLFNFFIRYKLFHVLFWLFMIFWHLHGNDGLPLDTAFKEKLFILILTMMLCVYFIQYLLIPTFLHKKKYVLFPITALSFIMLCSVFNVVIVNILIHIHSVSKSHNIIAFSANFIDILIASTLFMAASLTYDAIMNQKASYDQKEKLLQYEIDMLRQQMNPHFLFNALNSIYILMDSKPLAAKNNLMKFSQLLRHQLYESQHKLIDIQNEISFIKDYVSIEKIRKENDLIITEDYVLKNQMFQIPPMLLQPLVENSFKYVSTQLAKNFISIECELTPIFFMFTITNSIDELYSTHKNENGIGIPSIKKRIELSYPNKNSFNIVVTENKFEVSLKILI